MTQGAVAARGVRHTVGIGDMHVTAAVDDQIITYALGSCLGICLYDPVARVSGLVHVLLPEAAASPDKAAQNPCLFVDTGIPRLFRECYALGAAKPRIILTVAGGASMGTVNESEDHFQIGRRNLLSLKRLLWKNGVLIRAQSVGGHAPRTMKIRASDGEVTIVSQGIELPLERRG